MSDVVQAMVVLGDSAGLPHIRLQGPMVRAPVHGPGTRSWHRTGRLVLSSRGRLVAGFKKYVNRHGELAGTDLDESTVRALDVTFDYVVHGHRPDAEFEALVLPTLRSPLAVEGPVEVFGWLVEDTRSTERLGAYYTERDVARYVAEGSVSGALFARLAPALGNAPWTLLSESPSRYVRIPETSEVLVGEPYGHVFHRIRARADRLASLATGSVTDAVRALAASVNLPQLLLDSIMAVGRDAAALADMRTRLAGFLIADYSAGSGQLLLPAAALLLRVQRILHEEDSRTAVRSVLNSVAAFDKDGVALHGLRLRLAMMLADASGSVALSTDDTVVLSRNVREFDLVKSAQTIDPLDLHRFLPMADAVIGNPPYLRRTPNRTPRVTWWSGRAPDVCAMFVEQALVLAKQGAWIGLVLPLSVQSSRSYSLVRREVGTSFDAVVAASFSRRPASLFPRAGVRTAILFGALRTAKQQSAIAPVYVTGTQRWIADHRKHVFECLTYRELPSPFVGTTNWPRLPNDGLAEVFARLSAGTGQLGDAFSDRGDHAIGIRANALYELTAFPENLAPRVWVAGMPEAQSMLRWVYVDGADERDLVLAVLLSKLALVWWHSNGDDLNVTRGVLASLPVNLKELTVEQRRHLVLSGCELRRRLPGVRTEVKYNGRTVEGYAIRRLRDLTDQVDRTLACAFRYEQELPALEHAYAVVTRGLPERDA